MKIKPFNRVQGYRVVCLYPTSIRVDIRNGQTKVIRFADIADDPNLVRQEFEEYEKRKAMNKIRVG